MPRTKIRVDLNRYAVEEAPKFEVPVSRALAIAQAIETEPAMSVQVTRTESEFRERLERIYSEQLAAIRACLWPGCEFSTADVHEWLAHHRIHLVLSSPNHIVRAGVLNAIEAQLDVRRTTGAGASRGALPFEERRRLEAVLESHGLIDRTRVPKQDGGNHNAKGSEEPAQEPLQEPSAEPASVATTTATH